MHDDDVRAADAAGMNLPLTRGVFIKGFRAGLSHRPSPMQEVFGIAEGLRQATRPALPTRGEIAEAAQWAIDHRPGNKWDIADAILALLEGGSDA